MGKKTEVITLNGLHATISEKTLHQLLAKVPSVFVNVVDGSGNEVNISTRDLDPHGTSNLTFGRTALLLILIGTVIRLRITVFQWKPWSALKWGKKRGLCSSAPSLAACCITYKDRVIVNSSTCKHA
ncbi:hypothetical protein AHMF7605_05935 [Adhaeribacter arboris]|uniref:Uncharacterized protein n=1 Tax=Adhaeribacter arboris TaxID=2072846 RepID=A0A2T2YCD0_9BACT|nr:hypothetical protein [Adhaeribacter arboris]PSR53098.1 hypothetical protein AHMF7605_05935 [Adhaeribacter arboris]